MNSCNRTAPRRFLLFDMTLEVLINYLLLPVGVSLNKPFRSIDTIACLSLWVKLLRLGGGWGYHFPLIWQGGKPKVGFPCQPCPLTVATGLNFLMVHSRPYFRYFSGSWSKAFLQPIAQK